MLDSGGLELEASESMGCATNRTRIPSLAAPCSLKLLDPDIPAPVAREPKASPERAQRALPVFRAKGIVTRVPTRGLVRQLAHWAMGCCPLASCDMRSEPPPKVFDVLEAESVGDAPRAMLRSCVSPLRCALCPDGMFADWPPPMRVGLE